MMDAESTKPASSGVEFLLCGSPTDAFYSQIAFFRLSLDRLGPQGREARVVAVFGADECSPLPSRWERHFDRIEVHHASPDEFRRTKYFAASDLRYRLVTPGSACSVLCDADTMLVRPLPPEFLAGLHRAPAICGVIAHFPFPIEVDTRTAGSADGLYPGMPQEQAWDHLGQAILGRAPERPLRYTLTTANGDDRCPFYVNYGFLAGPADLLSRLADELEQVQPALDEIMGGYFVGQVGIALAVERAQLPWRALPMRFNYPNDRMADLRYPEELDQVVMFHYLRDTHFDRHRIFADRQAFEAFLALDLMGSDRVFRDHVVELTGGRYPFCEPVTTRSVICVLGMHRAGTSATTGAINQLGIHLGPPEHMMISGVDNPTGFFEHQKLTDLNDEVLLRLGGSWHEPPSLQPGWADVPDLLDLRERASRVLLEDFGSTPQWGWKDPRTCLTLPFWQPLLPETRYVVCVRHPFDVARSLQNRNGFSIEKGVALWMEYMTLAVRHLESSPVLLVVYNDLVDHTEIEVERMAAFVGAAPLEATVRETAVRSITNELRHYRAEPDDLFAGDGPWHDAAAFYVFLRSLAALQRDERQSPDAPSSFGQWLALHQRRAWEGRAAIPEVAALRQTLESERAEAAHTIDALRAAADERQRVLDDALAETTRSVEGWRAAAGALEQAQARIETLERQRDEQGALLEHLQTPSGAFKLALRAWLPASAHGRLRRWGLRWFPDLSRDRTR